MSKKNKDPQTAITFVIFTYNEEKRIIYPLKNFLDYGKILVVDNYSTDRTREIARAYGAKVIKYKNPGWIETEEEMNFVFRHIDTDWVYLASADEMIPKTCLELYQKIARESKYKIVVQKKKSLLYRSGTDFTCGFININFFRKGTLQFKSNTVHQRGRFSPDVKPSDILYLPQIDEYSVYHFSVYNTEKFMKSLDTYSWFHAKTIPSRFLKLKLLVMPLYGFLIRYFYGGLYKIGMRGFISSVQSSISYFITLAKAYELQNNITLESIEKEFRKDKEKLLVSSPKSSLLRKFWAKITIIPISFLHKIYRRDLGSLILLGLLFHR